MTSFYVNVKTAKANLANSYEPRGDLSEITSEGKSEKKN